MENENEVQKNIKGTIETGDNLIGEGIAQLSNEVVPVVGPIVTRILWKYKWKILIIFLVISCFISFAFESLAFQYSANSHSLLDDIPQEHSECITKAKEKYGIEFELLAAYGKVFADFNEKHTGAGKGFLEISNETWVTFGADGNSNNLITEKDICDNYFTLAHKLSSISGNSEEKINHYPYSKSTEVKQWYELYIGISQIPYGNPIGLDRPELVVVTSGYNVVRIVFGVKNTHKGIDIVPSSTWFKENPGKGSTQAIDRAIISGKVSNFKDKYGALCSYVFNDSYRTLYCHCDSFIAKDQSQVKYGDPVCYMGSTGFSTGNHTHIEVYKKNNKSGWDRVDPTPFLFPTKNNK